MRVIGLMSGTSYDAVDAAAADLVISGDTVVLTPLGLISGRYDDELRAALSSSLPPATVTMGQVCRLDTGIGQAFASAAERADRELCGGRAELVASHGQTVYHWTSDGRVLGTLQLGQPAWIAERTGLPVVSDFRPRDIAAGGQGAPLVSMVDVMWLRDRPGTPVALNLGGIANITVAPASSGPLAFDTGPANALIDAVVRHHSGGKADYDVDGALAARGTVDQALLAHLLAEPYYALPPPKSTGKELFNLSYLQGFLDLPLETLVATLTALTARTVADAVRTARATEVIVSGGGTRNPTLMGLLCDGLEVPVLTSDSLGLPSDAKEAYAFAVLGFLSAHGLAGTLPSCTGADHATVLGSITPGRRPLSLPNPARTPPSRLKVAAAEQA